MVENFSLHKKLTVLFQRTSVEFLESLINLSQDTIDELIQEASVLNYCIKNICVLTLKS